MKLNKIITLGIELIDDPSWMGGTLYLRNLATCLARLPDETRPDIRLIGTPAVVKQFREQCQFPHAFEAQPGQSRLAKLLVKLGWNRQDSEHAIDAIYPGFGTNIPGAVTIRWIPDFQHRYLPHLFSEEEIAARDKSIEDIARRPCVVVLSSESAAADFCHFFPGHRATPRVWHFHSILDLPDSAPCEEIRNQFNFPEKYLYLPNQFWAHKNHITVFRALEELKKKYRIMIPLVCTGAQTDRRNESHFKSLQMLLEDNNLTGQVFFLGLLPRAKQIAILRCAAAVVQPSLFEGWSTVVEDTRAAGRPILLSDISVHKEQSPARARYFSAESSEQLAQLLAEVWPLLQPGPDTKTEEEARYSVDKLILESAHRFNNIVRDALSISKCSTSKTELTGSP